jgi:hypothetical protein
MHTTPILDKFIVSLGEKHGLDFHLVRDELVSITNLDASCISPLSLSNRYWSLKSQPCRPLLSKSLPCTTISDDEDSADDFTCIPDQYKTVIDLDEIDSDDQESGGGTDKIL